MSNESVFIFLNNDERFAGIYRKCIDLEKGISNNLYDALRNASRQICERLLQIIIIDDQHDEYLADSCFKRGKGVKNLTLSETIDECRNMGYISRKIQDKFHTLRKYGNWGSHYNEDELTLDTMKKIHRFTFDIVVDCYSRFADADGIEYEFRLNSGYFTQKELDDLLGEIPNDVLTSSVADEMEKQEILMNIALFEHLSEIFRSSVIDRQGYDSFLSENLYVTRDNLDVILSAFDGSVRSDLSESVEKTHSILIKKFKRLPDVVNLLEIRGMAEKTTDSIERGFYQLVEGIAAELIKNHFRRVSEELSSLKVIDSDNNIVDAPDYEIVEKNGLLTIEKALGIPDKCPKCGANFAPGSLKCPGCGYDLFDELNRRCPKCGKRIPFGSKFCIRCGGNLEKYKCGKCGYENKKGSKFCVKCGNKL